MLKDIKLSQRYQDMADGKPIPNETGFPDCEWEETCRVMRRVLNFAKHATGIYEGVSFSPNNFFENIDSDYVNYMSDIHEGYPPYGVCDNYEQILEEYPKIKTSEDDYVIFLTAIIKKNEPSEGGWRWHKWGPYIGEHKPTSEYLYDEEDIERVYVYSIYKVKKEKEDEK